jgi:hypothetical protein
MSMTELNTLERAVLTKLFEGEHPALLALRRQLEVATVMSRRVTGSGFFTTFALPSETPPAPVKKARFGDVEARIVGLKYGAGFLVYVDDGELHMLEGYSYEELWPESVQSFELRYVDEARPSLARAFS